MGAKLSKYFMSRKQQQTKAMVGSNSSSSDGKPSSDPSQGPTSIIELIKPECLKTKKMVKKKRSRHLNPAEKTIAKARKLTLEDLLLASPGGPGLKPERFSGELHVFKQFSRRVHPSTARVVNEATTSVVNEATTSRPRESFCLECENSCVSRSQSGKLKKRVSFKLPEEADIILFYSPEETLGSE